MTNQTNANVTCKPSTLNLERMTHEYFYMDVLCGDVTKMKIPTVDELEFLGANNVWEIHSYMRGEERKLRKVLKDTKRELHFFETMTPATVQRKFSDEDGKIHCNWRGLEYAKIPQDVEAELLENGSAESYCNVANNRERQIFTCKFGRETAEWCSKSPNPRSCNNSCFKMGVATVLSCGAIDSNSVSALTPSCCEGVIDIEKTPKCSHYDACHGSEELKDVICIFDHAGEELWDACKKNLHEVINGYHTRLVFIEKYMANLTTVLKHHSGDDGHKPPFDLSIRHSLAGVKNKDAIVKLYRSENGHISMSHGLLAARMKSLQGGSVVILNMFDGEVLSVSTDMFSKNASRSVFLRREDFEYLLNNPDFRQVWLQMAEMFGTELTADALTTLLDAVASRRKSMDEFFNSMQ